MLAKRIIPCLDICDGRTVKGTNFINLKDAGDPVELAIRYCEEGADELIFLDITATVEKRQALAETVKKIAAVINIPFTVGGGITTIHDVDLLLHNGADKISINSAAVKNPKIIEEMASNFGSQCIVVAIDGRIINNQWEVVVNGGRTFTGYKLTDWVKEVNVRGAGEILLTSMEADGTKGGFSVEVTKKISSSVTIPVIASGGAGTMQHFADIFIDGRADAALAASVFHFNEINIAALKTFLKDKNIPVRI